jgi:hypothetical protein
MQILNSANSMKMIDNEDEMSHWIFLNENPSLFL